MELRSGIGLPLLILTFAASTFAICPEGWTSAGFHCYKAFDDVKSWEDAESHCQSFNLKDNQAHLVSVSDIPENVLLKTWFESTKADDADPWIGLEPTDSDDDETEDNNWSDGSHAALDVFVEEGILEQEFLDNHDRETCLVLNTQKGTWQPTDCDESKPYVCKVHACPDGWVSYGGRCYQAFPTKKSWVYAEKHCRSYSRYGGNAHLVSVADNLENRFLTTMLEDIPQPFWIGMKGVTNKGSALWADDERFDLAAVEQATVDRKAKNNTCVGMQVEKDMEMQAVENIVWKDAACKVERSFVCKLSHCRRGWTALDGSCKWYTFQNPAEQVQTQHKDKRRVRRAAFRSFNVNSFNRRFQFGRSFKTFAKPHKPTTTTNTASSGSSLKTITSKTTAGTFGRRTFTSKSFGSLLGNQPKQPKTIAMPNKDLPKLNPSKQVGKISANSGDNSMRCMGRRWTPMGNECTQYVPMPDTYDRAMERCQSFVYTGDDMIPSRGRLKEAKEMFDKKPMRMASYTCVMKKVRKLKLI